MASPFYIGNRKVKLRFLIFIVLLILGFSYMYKLLMPSYKYISIDYKKITMEKSIPVLLIRDEKVFNSPIYGKAIKNVRDGDTVNKDQQIAVLYKENYDEHIANQL
ncbi:MAG: HlyD family efflux transporter periplasmic adaptor subunit, partial [Caldicoprobacterales bacterium]